MFYPLTGRPLIWLGDCIEHSLVARIEDFRHLRIFPILVVLATVVILGRILQRVLGSSMAGWCSATLCIFIPGYSFMVLQGLTGVPVLLSVLLGALSFDWVRKGLEAFESRRLRRCSDATALAAILFVAACLIYPAFAFIVIPLSFAYCFFRKDWGPRPRFLTFFGILAFYGIASMIYYAGIKFGISLALRFSPDFQLFHHQIADLGEYQFSMDFGSLSHKIGLLLWMVSEMPISAFLSIPTLFKITLLAAPALVIAFEGSPSKSRRDPASALGYLILLPIAIVISMAPWLMSHYPQLFYRQELAMDAFPILCIGFLLSRAEGLSSRFVRSPIDPRTTNAAAMLLLLVTVSLRQLTWTQAEIVQSGLEIRYMRAAVKGLVADGRLWKLRQFHVIRSEHTGYGARTVDREFAPATQANPDHIFQMMTAILRDFLDEDQLSRLEMRACHINTDCVQQTPEHVLVITQSEPGIRYALHQPAYILDYRLLR